MDDRDGCRILPATEEEKCKILFEKYISRKIELIPHENLFDANVHENVEFLSSTRKQSDNE